MFDVVLRTLAVTAAFTLATTTIVFFTALTAIGLKAFGLAGTLY